ncbi:GDSL-type esterase/lipase family protein, partial [Klebsiella pneumoniae]|uniref:GDSL-type esterase/lipase family protein n=1 Tax=Klebsiella pneumoniae TaxID=573 RepID=UPI002ADFF99A
GWVALLEQRLAEQGYGYRVVNASISGETSAGGVVRLAHLLERHRPAVVVIELGANDGLRGLPVEALRKNLADLVARSRAAR